MKRIPMFLIVLLLGVFYGTFLSLSRYAFPAADDFAFLSPVRSPFAVAAGCYMSWSGRYSAFFFEAIFGYFDIVRWYFVPVVLYLVLLPISLISAVSSILWRKPYHVQGILPGLTISAIMIAGFPTIYEAFYWFIGATAYTLGLVFVFFYLGILFWQPQSRFSDRTRLGLLVLIGLVGAGVGDILTLIVVMTFGGLLVFQYITERKINTQFALSLLIWGIGLAVVTIAPGNRVRVTHFHNDMAITAVVMESAIYAVTAIVEWMTRPSMVSALVLLLIHGEHVGRRLLWCASLKPWQIALLACGFVCVVYLTYVAFLLITGAEPLPRVQNMIYAFAIVGSMGLVAVIGAYVHPHLTIAPKLRMSVTVVICGFLFWGVFVSSCSWYPQACRDLRGRGKRYHQEQMAQVSRVLAARDAGGKTVKVRDITTDSRILYSPSYSLGVGWICEGYARYFGIDEVILE